ncbi:hypothetical protein ACFE04_008209 [Oxalis oulophora]
MSRFLMQIPQYFKFHRECETIDDLLMFSVADENSSKWFKETLDRFYKVCGLLPKVVMHAVDKKCRVYLWEGTQEITKLKVQYSMENVCIFKKEGGIGHL